MNRMPRFGRGLLVTAGALAAATSMRSMPPATPPHLWQTAGLSLIAVGEMAGRQLGGRWSPCGRPETPFGVIVAPCVVVKAPAGR